MAILAALLLALPAHGLGFGEIRGEILDRATQQPLPGAGVRVLGTERGAMADGRGRFALPGIPAGVHRLRISMIGYAAIVRTDVVVRPRRVTDLELELDAEVMDLGEETVVVADYFSDAAGEAVGGVSFSYEEVRRSPGSAGDISRLLQAMPSVNMNTDERNDLIVRGGSPTENLVLVDHIDPGGLRRTDRPAEHGSHRGRRVLRRRLLRRLRGPPVVGDARRPARGQPRGDRRRGAARHGGGGTAG